MIRTGIVFFLVSLTSLTSFGLDRRCGTKDLDPGQKLIAELMSSPNIMRQSTVIDTIVHVISRNRLSQATIDEQMNVVNDAFRDSGFQFNLIEVNVVTDSAMITDFEGNGIDKVKRALRRGEANVLNIYFGNLDGGLLGFATFPWDYKNEASLDGVVVGINTVPGGSSDPYNEGQTLTHEIGHWAGLYHTFQGGCSASNDYIEDTPAHTRPTFGCPTGTLSKCSGVNQSIPVANFMNYTDDACMTEFSPMQTERMTHAYYSFRRDLNIIQF